MDRSDDGGWQEVPGRGSRSTRQSGGSGRSTVPNQRNASSSTTAMGQPNRVPPTDGRTAATRSRSPMAVYAHSGSDLDNVPLQTNTTTRRSEKGVTAKTKASTPQYDSRSGTVGAQAGRSTGATGHSDSRHREPQSQARQPPSQQGQQHQSHRSSEHKSRSKPGRSSESASHPMSSAYNPASGTGSGRSTRQHQDTVTTQGGRTKRSGGSCSATGWSEDRAQHPLAQEMHGPSVAEYSLEDHLSKLQMQEQAQAQRAAEASLQMVYDSFTWTVAAIEILEQDECREQQQHIPGMSATSQHLYQVQVENHRKAKAEITRDGMVQRCNNNLLVLKSQLSSCDDAVRARANANLKDTALLWANTCAEGTPLTLHFKQQMLQVLEGHQPQLYHTESLRQKFTKKWMPDSGTMGRVFQTLQSALRTTDAQDEEFASDPSKKAVLPDFRTNGAFC